MVVIVVATVCPWYIATTVGGSATLAGWGAWTEAGDLNASLRPLPLAVLAYLPAGFMIFSALRERFGAALIGAMATVAAAILPFMTEAAVDRRLPGGDSVAVDVGRRPSWCWRSRWSSSSSAGSATHAGCSGPPHAPSPTDFGAFGQR